MGNRVSSVCRLSPGLVHRNALPLDMHGVGLARRASVLNRAPSMQQGGVYAMQGISPQQGALNKALRDMVVQARAAT